MRFRCSLCQQHYPLHTREWRCSRCQSPFELDQSFAFKRSKIDKRVTTLWRYRAMLPELKEKNIVSLGEGWTPLVEAVIEGRRILCKLDYFSPTGSFKDRGTTVLVSFLKELGIETVVEDSSGNAAASLASYCARAGIKTKIFAPADASPAKLAQIKIFGAELCPIEGPREKSAKAAQAVAKEFYYASHVYNPIWLEGIKTYAYELWEQLDGKAPDAMVAPAGHGSLVRGAYKGFAELQSAGLIKRIPRLYAVQAEIVAPLYKAWTKKLDQLQDYWRHNLVDLLPGQTFSTIAEGIAVSRPPHWAKILHFIRDTGGSVVTVSDKEILRARNAMAHQGLFIEPSSAAAIAGLSKLKDQIKPRDLVVVLLTGSGLKSSTILS
ncbi:threonine synthase [Candidatus Acetothermia bacterium]|nr:threonine synthase [Candidatus Acetothermia bacterium]